MKYNRAMTDAEGTRTTGDEGPRAEDGRRTVIGDTARVTFHSHAYTSLMEAARARMPGETIGFLFGTTRAGTNGQLRITVKEVAPLKYRAATDAEQTRYSLLGHRGCAWARPETGRVVLR